MNESRDKDQLEDLAPIKKGKPAPDSQSKSGARMSGTIRRQDSGVLRSEDTPTAEPVLGDPRFRSGAVSVNPVDYKILHLSHPRVKTGDMPIRMGSDISGLVDEGGV